ncbi:hypothetical protein TSOC_015340, partial [Tetrabaena socialis]
DEYQNALEDAVARHVARIAQLRQDYGLMVKEASRRHMELQQRRFAGARVDIPQLAPGLPPPGAGLPPLGSAAPLMSAPPSRASAAVASDQAHSHSQGQVNPNAYLKTLDVDAQAAMSNFATHPPNGTAHGIGALRLGSPSSPAGRLATPADAGTRASDFARLEAMHDKYMGRTRSLHEQGLSSRANEAVNWQHTFAACMGALAQHQSGALAHLASCVEEAEAWHAQQRTALAVSHEEVRTGGRAGSKHINSR